MITSDTRKVTCNAIDRRRFTTMTCAAGAVALAGAAALSGRAANPASIRIRKSVKYGMIREGKTLLEKLQVLKRAGFDGLELTLQKKIPVKEVRAAVDATGVVVHGIVHSHSEEFATPIRYCKAVGGDAVLIIAKTDNRLSHAENNKRVHTAIRAALPLAEKNGIRLLVENVRASPHLNTAESMAEFIDAAGSPMVGAYYDTGNTISWTNQSAEHWARVLGKRIVKIDIKDRGHPIFGDPKTASQTAIGTNGGEVHWENVRKELAAINYTGWAAAEVAGGDQKRLTDMAHWVNDVLQL